MIIKSEDILSILSYEYVLGISGRYITIISKDDKYLSFYVNEFKTLEDMVNFIDNLVIYKKPIQIGIDLTNTSDIRESLNRNYKISSFDITIFSPRIDEFNKELELFNDKFKFDNINLNESSSDLQETVESIIQKIRNFKITKDDGNNDILKSIVITMLLTNSYL
ncbi:hypothetical protein [Clostridium perfringens]|uniref:hypothetical protein n=1 Tax=Clostridium perfringens TaxID=1502 RepID=UPI001A31BFF1|nr:hypothetical protein [Clostridium perfringens]